MCQVHWLVRAYDVGATGLMQKYVLPRVYTLKNQTPRPHELNTCFRGSNAHVVGLEMDPRRSQDCQKGPAPIQLDVR